MIDRSMCTFAFAWHKKTTSEEENVPIMESRKRLKICFMFLLPHSQF